MIGIFDARVKAAVAAAFRWGYCNDRRMVRDKKRATPTV
jgi:hypothetical protein